MRFSPRSRSNTDIDSWQNKTLTVPADQAPILAWQTDFGSHGYFSGRIRIMLRQILIFAATFFSQVKKNGDALSCDAFCFCIHVALLRSIVQNMCFFNELAFSNNQPALARAAPSIGCIGAIIVAATVAIVAMMIICMPTRMSGGFESVSVRWSSQLGFTAFSLLFSF